MEIKLKDKTNENSLIKSYELQQITDLIQFQAYDYKEDGNIENTKAYLRVSEVKPKLDKFIYKFLLKNLTSKNNHVNVYSINEDGSKGESITESILKKYKKYNDVIKDEFKLEIQQALDKYLFDEKILLVDKEQLKNLKSDDTRSFNYAMKIEANGDIEINDWERDKRGKLTDDSNVYFAVMNYKSSDTKYPQRVYYKNSIMKINYKKHFNLVISIKNNDIDKNITSFKDLVEFCLPFFFAQINFGARSSKGYGSFKYLRSVKFTIAGNELSEDMKKGYMKKKEKNTKKGKKSNPFEVLKELDVYKNGSAKKILEQNNIKKINIVTIEEYKYDDKFRIGLNLFTDFGKYYEVYLNDNTRKDYTVLGNRENLMGKCAFFSNNMKSGDSRNKINGAIIEYFKNEINNDISSDKKFIKDLPRFLDKNIDVNNDKYLYIRGLLGLYDYLDLNAQSDKYKDGKVKFKYDEIDRMESPLLIKPFGNSILFIPKNNYEKIESKLFKIEVSLKGNELKDEKLKNLLIKVPGKFNIVKFLDYFFTKYLDANYKREKEKMKIFSISDEKEAIDGR